MKKNLSWEEKYRIELMKKEGTYPTYFSKCDILKKVKNWIKEYDLGNYLTLGDDEVLHINEDFKEKLDKLIQDNPNGFLKYIIKILGYENIVEGVAQKLFKKIEPTIEGGMSERDLNNYIKEFIKNGSPDKYVEDFKYFFDAVMEYYKSKEPEIKESLKASNIANIFNVVNDIDNFNYEMKDLYYKAEEYKKFYEESLYDRAKSSYSEMMTNDRKKRLNEKYDRMLKESKKYSSINENLKFVDNLYSETYELSKKCAKTFLHDKSGDKLTYVLDSYFERWEIEDESKSLSHSNKLLNDVTNYLLKNYNYMSAEKLDSFDFEIEEKKM